MSGLVRNLTLTLLALLLAACSSGGDDASFVTPAPVLQAIAISPQDAELPVTAESQYTAIGEYSDGSNRDITAEVSWSSSRPEIAGINTVGLAQAIAEGETQIAASLDGIDAETSLTVIEAALLGLEIFPAQASMKLATTQDYRAYARYADGRLENVTFTAEWSLVNESGIVEPFGPVLTLVSNGIDDFGTALAVDVGDDEILVQFDGLDGTSDIEVQSVSLESLTISPRDEVLLEGTSQQYAASGNYADGTSADLTNVVTWSTGNSNVFRISNEFGEKGAGNAVSPGLTTVTATLENLSDTTNVGVLDEGGTNPVTRLDVLPAQQQLEVGGQQQYQAIAYLADGRAFDVTANTTWSVSDTSVASITNDSSSRGIATALSDGQTQVIAVFGENTGTASLLVSDDALTLVEINVSPVDALLFVDGQLQYTAIGVYGDGSSRDITTEVVWSAADPSVIQLANDDFFGHGLSLGLAPGQTEVIASQVDGFISVSGSTPVTVIEAPGPDAALVVLPTPLTTYIGVTLQYLAEVRLADGRQFDVSDDVAWSSSDTAVASINSAGLARTEGAGAAEITARLFAGGLQFAGLADLFVREPAVGIKEIVVSPPVAEILVNTTQAYTARALLTDGSEVLLEEGVSWFSGNDGVAIISPEGLATGVAAGDSLIQASVIYGGEIYTGEAALTVKPEPVVVEELVVSPAVADVLIGASQSFVATAYLSDGTDQEVTDNVTWQTSDASVAQVDGAGLATGLAEGQAQLSATLIFQGESFVDQGTLNVFPAPVTVLDLLVEPPQQSAAVGTSAQFTATASLSNGEQLDVSSDVSWRSLNPLIAKVDDQGLASSIAVGSAEIVAALFYQGETFTDSGVLDVPLPALQELKVEPEDAQIVVGAAQSYAATAQFDDGSEQDVTADAIWSSSDSAIAAIDASGRAQGLAPGTVSIVAGFEYDGQLVETPVSLTVADAPVTVVEIQISPQSATILVDEEQAYTATALLSDDSAIDVTDSAAWLSEDNSIAHMSPDGVATGLAVGLTAITASLNLNGEVFDASAELQVDAAVVLTSVVVEPENSTISLGEMQSFTATAVYSDASTEDVTSRAEWSSSAPEVASVDGDGLSLALSEGVAVISAGYEGESDSSNLTVTGAVAVELFVAPPILSGPEGTSGRAVALARFSDGTVRGVSEQATWSSAEPTIADVDVPGDGRGARISYLQSGTTSVAANYEGLTSAVAITVTAPVLDSIQVSPAIQTSPVGIEVSYVATALYTNGSSEDVTADATWTSSEQQVSGLVEPGRFVGLSAGSSTISAEFESTVGSAQHVVEPAEVVDVVVSPPVFIDPAGTTRQFTAHANYSDGSQSDVTREAQWRSSRTGVATVVDGGDTAGLVTLVAEGVATISATFGGATDQSVVTVTPAVLVDIFVEPYDDSFPDGGFEVQFSAIAVYSNGDQTDITDEGNWFSDDSAVAVAGVGGSVFTVSEGRTTISVSLDGSDEVGRAPINVVPASVTDLQILPGSVDDPAGAKTQLRAIAFYDNGQSERVTKQSTWLSNDSQIATVIGAGEDAGFLELLAQGTTQVSASFKNVTQSIDVTVTEAELVDIQVQPANKEIALGLAQQYEAIGIYSDGSSGPISFSQGRSFNFLNEEVFWTSDNESVASIDQSGLAQSLSQGQTRITARFENIAGRTNLNVVAAEVEKLTIVPFISIGAAGTDSVVSVFADLSDGSSDDVTNLVGWQSSAGNVATVGAGGLLSHNGVGTAVITASLAGVTTTALAFTTAAQLESLVLTPSQIEVPVGLREAFVLTGFYSDGSSLELNEEADWSVATPAIATVNSLGLVTGEAEGVTEVTASFGGLTATAPVLVTEAQLQSIQITPADFTAPVGTTDRLTATGFYSDGSSRVLTSQVTWLSANTTIANVGNGLLGGFIQLLREGQTQVSAQLDDISDVIEVQVTGATLVSIQVDPSAATIPRGSTQQFRATGLLSDGGFIDLNEDTGLRWSSENDTLAFIGPDGLAVGFALFGEGSTTITATQDGISGEAELYVSPAEIRSIAVTPAGLVEPAGTTVQLIATATYTDSTQRDVTDTASWSSTDTSVVLVQNGASAGIAELLAAGTANAQATISEVSGSTLITVTDAVLEKITVRPSNDSVAEGTKVQYEAEGLYSNGIQTVITGDVTWQSSATAIATIDQAGLADTVGVGETTISASLEGVTGETALTVTDAGIVNLQIQPAFPQELFVNQLSQYEAIAEFTNGDTANVTSQVNWTVEPSEIAAFAESPAGELTALRAGQGNVKAVYLETELGPQVLGSAEDTVGLTVIEPEIISVEINTFRELGAPVEMPLGSEEQWQAFANLSDGTQQDITKTASWTSDDPGTAAVVRESGAELAKVTAVASGSTQIRIEYSTVARFSTRSGGSTFVDAVDVTVLAAPLTAIEVNPQDEVTDVGGVVNYTAIGIYDGAPNRDITSEAAWNSVDDAVAEVSAGVARGLSVGQSQIEAIVGDITGTSMLTVVDRLPTQIVVEPQGLRFAVGSTWPYTATAIYDGGASADVTLQANWASSNTGVAVVNNESASSQPKGFATAVGAGTTTISATLDGVVGTATLEVTDECPSSSPNGKPDIVEVLPADETIALGDRIQLNAIGVFFPGELNECRTTYTTDPQTNWRVLAEGNPNRAAVTVSKDGLAAGVDCGSEVVEAKYRGISGTTTVTVDCNL